MFALILPTGQYFVQAWTQPTIFLISPLIHFILVVSAFRIIIPVFKGIISQDILSVYIPLTMVFTLKLTSNSSFFFFLQVYFFYFNFCPTWLWFYYFFFHKIQSFSPYYSSVLIQENPNIFIAGEEWFIYRILIL